jgi:hypothetical protein
MSHPQKDTDHPGVDRGEYLAMRAALTGLMRTAESKAEAFDRLGFPEYARDLRQDAEVAQALLKGGDAAVLRLIRQRETANPQAEQRRAA